MGRRRALRGIVVIITLIIGAGVVAMSSDASAVSNCGPSSSFTLCITAPNGVLTGEVPITLTATGAGTPFEVAVSWGPSATSTTPLHSDFEAPWSFTWPTQRYADTTQYLIARVENGSGVAGAAVAIQVTIDNGNATAPTTPSDWASTFQPRAFTGDPIIAAVGDGADGTTRGNGVASSIFASSATAFLQLGDVYERGTRTEFFNHYGEADFDDPANTARWGRLASFTLPTGGNHELHSTSDDGAADYWHHRPLYYTQVVGGVRVISLASECSRVGGCGTTSAMYQWAQSVLQSNTLPCVVGTWHRPVISSVEDSAAMAPLWALLANNGGDMVLSGHTHSMSAYEPMNATLQTGQANSHMVQLISGAGGHNLVSATESDARVSWERTKVAGAAYITAIGGAAGSASSLQWRFADAGGVTVTSANVPGTGSVSCGAGSDTEAPDVPGQPTGSASGSSTINLSWPASDDDIATTLTYRVYRDGGSSAVATIQSASTTTVSAMDTGLASGSAHTYEVTASDGVNTSARSLASDPITTDASTVVYSDAFDSLAGWSIALNLTLDATQGSSAPPSVHAIANGGRAYGYHNLSTALPTVCVSARVNVSSNASDMILLKSRTAADVGLARLALNTSRRLSVRNDTTGAVTHTGVTLPTGWQTVELCTTVGAPGSMQALLNGTTIANVTAGLGTTNIGRVQIFDNNTGRTFNGRMDDLLIDTAPG
jgi:hypothetical protein